MEVINPDGVYIVAAKRTPLVNARGEKITALQGGDDATRQHSPFFALSSDYLLAQLFVSMVRETNLNVKDIADVIVGCVGQSGEQGANIARIASLEAGIPAEVPASTVNRLCASSMEATVLSAERILSGRLFQQYVPEVIIAAGVEQMSRYPIDKVYEPSAAAASFMRQDKITLAASMGLTAERLVEKFWITSSDRNERITQLKEARQAQDRFAYESHKKAVIAQVSGIFSDEIMPVDLQYGRGILSNDIGPREYKSEKSALEALARLSPAFLLSRKGTVTAGNSSPETDGAAALLMMRGEYALQHGYKPFAEIVSWGTSGIDPTIMGYGPISATEIALARADLGLNDIGLIELNEAFAAQALTVIEKGWNLKADDSRINPNGGAIALGHPLGASGARILTTLVHELKRRPNVHYGLATMCVGMGQGQAVIVKNMNYQS